MGAGGTRLLVADSSCKAAMVFCTGCVHAPGPVAATLPATTTRTSPAGPIALPFAGFDTSHNAGFRRHERGAQGRGASLSPGALRNTKVCDSVKLMASPLSEPAATPSVGWLRTSGAEMTSNP